MKTLFLLCVSLLVTPTWSQQNNLQTIQAKVESIAAIRLLYAKVEAKYQATISAQTSGRVVAVNVDIGDYVKKNTILLRLRSTSQQARYNAAEARYKKATADYTRARQLYKKRLYSKALLDKSAADAKSSLSEFNQAKEELERTVIRAPYHGIVVKRHIEAGETARVGQALLTGLSLETLDIVVEVPQSIIKAIRLHKKASVRLNGKMHQITKLNISPYADPDSHTFTVKARLPKGNFGVYPGMFISIYFETGHYKRLVIPYKSVIHRSEISAVYTVNANHIRMRQVRTGRVLPSGKVEIISGLSSGEYVALDPVRATLLLKQSQ